MAGKPAGNLSGFIFLLYLSAFLASIVYGLSSSLNPKNDEEPLFFAAVGFTLGVILLVLIGILIATYSEKDESGLEIFLHSRRRMLIWLGIGVCLGFFPRIAVVWISGETWLLWYIIHVSLGGIVFSFSFYLMEPDVRLQRNWTDTHSWHIFSIHLLLLFVTIFLATGYREHRFIEIVICTTFFSVITVLMWIEFAYVARGMMEVVPDEDEEALDDLVKGSAVPLEKPYTIYKLKDENVDIVNLA